MIIDPTAEARLMARTLSLVEQAMDMDWEREPNPYEDEQALEDRYGRQNRG